MEVITYEAIRSLHRAEKEQELQKLPDNFFQAVRNWFAHKEKQKDTTSLLEVENARKLIDEIIAMREKKIVMAALRTIRGDIPPRNLTDIEQKFFDHTLNNLKSFKESMNEKFKGPIEVVEEKFESAKKSLEVIKKEEKIEEILVKPNGKMILKVLADIPRFVGSDLQPYGPLKIGDVITLPEEVGKVLLTRKAAEHLLD